MVSVSNTELVSVYDSRFLMHTPFSIDATTTIGFRFSLDRRSRLKQVASKCPGYCDDIGTMTMCIYRWNETYEKTVSKEPVFSETFVDYGDNATVLTKISDVEITDGDFLLIFKDGKDGVGLWCSNVLPSDNADKIKYNIIPYINGTEGGSFMPMCILEISKVFPKDYVRDGWMFPDIPSYDYGVLATDVYNCGQGMYLKDEFNPDNDSQMICISDTTKQEFSNYLHKLWDNCFFTDGANGLDGNIYWSFIKENIRIYCYYTEVYGTARIIIDKTSAIYNKFCYNYDKKDGDTTELYQYGLCMATEFNPDPNYLEYIGGGMAYVIKLADNGIYMIDGGMFTQYDEAHCKEVVRFLRQITKTPEDERVRIACWHITHGHDDHNSGFAYFMKHYHDEIFIERVLFNLPDEFNENKALVGNCEYNHSAFESILNYWPDVVEVKCHTGQKFRLADIDIEILFTHEDLVDPKTGKSTAEEFNATSTISKITFDYKTFMVTGDVTNTGEKCVVESFSWATLRSDIIQASHHMINPLYFLYQVAKPSILLAPQSDAYIDAYPSMKYFRKCIAGDFEKVFYAGTDTVGLKVENGEIVDFYHGKIVGGRYTDWEF